MNPASSTSKYAKTCLETGIIGRPSKRIRTATCCAIVSVESMNLSGIDAFQRGQYVEAEEHYTRALNWISSCSTCWFKTGISTEAGHHSATVASSCNEMPTIAMPADDDSSLSSEPTQEIVQPFKYDEGMDVFHEPETISNTFEADAIESRLYYNLGLVKITRGKCDEALPCFETSFLRIQESIDNEELLQFRILHKIGFCNFVMGNGDRATETFQRAMELATHASLDELAIGASLNCLAVVYFHFHSEKADRAMQLLKRSWGIYRKRLGNVSKEVATVLNNMGRIHYLRSEYKEALAVYAEALVIRIEVLGGDSADVAATVYNSGQCYHQLGQLDSAMQYYKRFLGLTQKMHDSSSKDAAIVYRGIGEIHQQKSEMKLALSAFQNALQAEKESLGKFHQDVASTLNKLGNLCYEMQDPSLALKYYQEGLEIETVILDPLHPHIIITLTNIAHIEKLRRNYAAALHAYLQVHEKQRKSNTDTITLAVTLSSIGLVQYHLRQYEEAFESYQEALRLRREYFGTDDTPDIASTLNSIGLVLFKQKVFDLSRNCFLESLRIRTKLLGSDHKDVAILWYNIATIYFETGNDDLAIMMYKETLRVERAALGPNHPDVVMTLQHIGQVLQQVGNLVEALEYFQEALEIEKMFKRDDVSIAKILNLIGNIHLQEGNVGPMMISFSEASHLLEKSGNRTEGLVIAGYNFYGLSKIHPKCAPVA